MVRQIGFVDPKKGLPIGFQQSGYIGNISYLVCLVNLRDSVNKKENIILGDIKITEVKDAVGVSVPLKKRNRVGAYPRKFLHFLPIPKLVYPIYLIMSINMLKIKRIDNAIPTDKSDIRYSKDTNFTKALTGDEKKKYNNAIMTGNDNGLRISDNSMLVECENKSEYQYKYVVYDEFEDGQRITDVYAIGKIDTNIEDDVPSQYHNIAKYINYVMEIGYDNKQNIRALYKHFLRDTSYVLSEYNNNTSRFNVIGRGSVKNGTNTLDKSVGRRSPQEDTGSVSSDTGRYSRKYMMFCK